jgi:hypothetical protein
VRKNFTSSGSGGSSFLKDHSCCVLGIFHSFTMTPFNLENHNDKLPSVPATLYGADVSAGDSRSFDVEEDRGMEVNA